MEGKRIFTRGELQQHLEAIDANWHRHGGEERDDLQEYLEVLFANLPARLKEPTAEQKAAVVIEVSHNLAMELVGRTLGSVYSTAEIFEVLDEIWTAALLQGATEREDLLTVETGVFLELFDLKFNSITLSDELLEAMGEVRTALTRRKAKRRPSSSEAAI